MWLADGWMNEYQLSLFELCLNCLDNLVLQSSVHILFKGCLVMSTDLGQHFDIMGIEHKLFLELWLYLPDCEALAPKPKVSLPSFPIIWPEATP